MSRHRVWRTKVTPQRELVNTYSENLKMFIYVGGTLSNEHCGSLIWQIFGPETFSSIDI